MNINVPVVFLIVTLSACSTTTPIVDPYVDSQLLGYWTGSSGSYVDNTNWVIWRRPSGKFEANFLVCRKGDIVASQREAGSWSHVDGSYKTRTEFLSNGYESWFPDTPDKVYVEEYKVTNISSTEFLYQNMHKNKKYKVIRVSRDYELQCM